MPAETPPPKRRFAPVPVETSTKSSKTHKPGASTSNPQPTDEAPKPPRKFAIEPVETSTKSSAHVSQKSSHDEGEEAPRKPRRFAVEPVETSVKKSSPQPNSSSEDKPKAPRKFAIQPVETSVKKSKPNDTPEPASKPPRKFNVEPVETTSKSTQSNHQESGSTRSKRSFAPQPVQETRRRRSSREEPKRRDSELDETPADIPRGLDIREPPRDYSPHLLSSRLRRASDESGVGRADFATGHMVGPNGENLYPLSDLRRAPLPHERRKERSESQSGNVRSHSFMCPDLETIASSESEPSDQGSPNGSASPSAEGSPLTASDGISDGFKHVRAENPDRSFSRYMHDLEAKRAEDALREAALAAFPNSDYHEPVQHYVDEDHDDGDSYIEDRPATWDGHDEDDDEFPKPKSAWRKASTKADWERWEMKKHHEEKNEKASSHEDVRKEKTPSPWWNPAAVRDVAQPVDSEMSNMLNRARPPMLGADLKFPRSQSPDPARFDITQGSHTLRSQMCYLTEQAEAREGEKDAGPALWGGTCTVPIIKENDLEPKDSKGLWGGYCAASPSSNGMPALSGPSGLVTPAVYEMADPFDEEMNKNITGNNLRPPAPPHAFTKMQKQGITAPMIDSVLNTENELDELMRTEYPDTFVTQVFNYLSLGYPSLARPFDDELSKISSIPVRELREDDAVARALPKGYIRVGDDFEGRGDGAAQDLGDDACVRWRALKTYIREWARQEKGMVQVHAAPWGAAARKGSWAW